jgi:hypothetical protein
MYTLTLTPSTGYQIGEIGASNISVTGGTSAGQSIGIMTQKNNDGTAAIVISNITSNITAVSITNGAGGQDPVIKPIPPNEYTVTGLVDPAHGTLTRTNPASGTITSGGSQTITLSANQGYFFRENSLLSKIVGGGECYIATTINGPQIGGGETYPPKTEFTFTINNITGNITEISVNVTMLVDKSALQNAVNTLNQNLEDLGDAVLTYESLDAVTKALEEANRVLGDENATPQDVLDAIEKINGVYPLKTEGGGEEPGPGPTPPGPTPIPTPNPIPAPGTFSKCVLQALVNAVKNLTEDHFKPGTYDEFAAALLNGKAVLKDDLCTWETYVDAIYRIQKSLDNLKDEYILGVQKGILAETIKKGEEFLEENEDLTDESKKAIEDAIKKGKEVLADENATVDDVKNATKGIVDAIYGAKRDIVANNKTLIVIVCATFGGLLGLGLLILLTLFILLFFRKRREEKAFRKSEASRLIDETSYKLQEAITARRAKQVPKCTTLCREISENITEIKRLLG